MSYHIFLLDALDEASEEQAIGRAYRIGQNKNTFIKRYLIHFSLFFFYGCF